MSDEVSVQLQQAGGSGGDDGGRSGGGKTRQLSPPPPRKCPRCGSGNTKFCYYNNYSTSQPRYYCKACRRYWTHGGALRNIPIGGGCRRPRRPRLSTTAVVARNDGPQIPALRTLARLDPGQTIAPPAIDANPFLSSGSSLQSRSIGGNQTPAVNLAATSRGVGGQQLLANLAIPDRRLLAVSAGLLPREEQMSAWGRGLMNGGGAPGFPAAAHGGNTLWNPGEVYGGDHPTGSFVVPNHFSGNRPGVN